MGEPLPPVEDGRSPNGTNLVSGAGVSGRQAKVTSEWSRSSNGGSVMLRRRQCRPAATRPTETPAPNLKAESDVFLENNDYRHFGSSLAVSRFPGIDIENAYPCKLGKTLRYFIAEDAITFAVKDPLMYRSLIAARPNATVAADKGVTNVSHAHSIESHTESSKVSPRSVHSNDSHRVGRPPPLESTFGLGPHSESPAADVKPAAASPVPGVPADRPNLRHWRLVLASTCSIVHTIRNFTALHHTAMVWGGLAVLLPYIFVSLAFTFPVVILELSLGNVFRGGFAKYADAISHVFRGLGLVAWLAGGWYVTQQTLDTSRLGFTLYELFLSRPGWIPPTAVRLDCEQTNPRPDACIQKEGCIYLDQVCTVDATYWAAQYNNSMGYPESERLVVSAALVWAFAVFCQASHLRPIVTLIGTCCLLGIFFLVYLCYQETALLSGQKGTLTIIPSLIFPRNEDVSFTIANIMSSGMWLNVIQASFESAGVGKGLLFGCAAFAPYGTNIVKLSTVLLIIDIIGVVSIVAIGDTLLRNIAHRTGKSQLELMKSLPHFFGILLPVTVQNVAHKKFVVQIVFLCSLLSEFASVTMGGYILAEVLHESYLMRRYKVPRLASIGIVAAVVGIMLSIRRMLASGNMIQAFESTFQMLNILIVFFECVLFGWLSYSSHQIRMVGSTATVGLMLMFLCIIAFGMTLGLASLLTLHNARSVGDVPVWINKEIPIIIGILSFCLLSSLTLFLLVQVGQRHFSRLENADNMKARTSTLKKLDYKPSMEIRSRPRRAATGINGRGGFFTAGPGSSSSFLESISPQILSADSSTIRVTEEEFPSSTKASESPSPSIKNSNLDSPPGKQKRQAKFSSEVPKIISGYSGCHAMSESESSSDDSARKRERRSQLRQVLWWLFLGNIELLRFDLNRLMAGGSVFRLGLTWGVSLKYLLPLVCVTLFIHQSSDILLSISGNLMLSQERLPMVYPWAVSIWKADLFIALWSMTAACLLFVAATGCICYFTPSFLSKLVPYRGSYPILNSPSRLTIPQNLWLDRRNLDHFMLLEFGGSGDGCGSSDDDDPLQSLTDMGNDSTTEFLHSRIYKKITTAVFERMTHQSLTDIEAIADELIISKRFTDDNQLESQSGPLG